MECVYPREGPLAITKLSVARLGGVAEILAWLSCAIVLSVGNFLFLDWVGAFFLRGELRDCFNKDFGRSLSCSCPSLTDCRRWCPGNVIAMVD